MNRVLFYDESSACLQLLWYNWKFLTGDLLGEARPPIKEFH